MKQVIRKHVGDQNESMLHSGTMTSCKKYVAGLKREAKKHFVVSKWCNNGFCVSPLYYVEITDLDS